MASEDTALSVVRAPPMAWRAGASGPLMPADLAHFLVAASASLVLRDEALSSNSRQPFSSGPPRVYWPAALPLISTSPPCRVMFTTASLESCSSSDARPRETSTVCATAVGLCAVATTGMMPVASATIGTREILSRICHNPLAAGLLHGRVKSPAAEDG